MLNTQPPDPLANSPDAFEKPIEVDQIRTNELRCAPVFRRLAHAGRGPTSDFFFLQVTNFVMLLCRGTLP